jgi:hypothetical protein
MLVGVFVKVGKPNTFPGMLLAELLTLLLLELMLDELMLDELDDFTELALLLPPLELTLDMLLRELVLLNELEVADDVVEELTENDAEELVVWELLDWLLLTELDSELKEALEVALPVALLFAATPEPLHAAKVTLLAMTSHAPSRRNRELATMTQVLGCAMRTPAVASFICVVVNI